MAQELLTAKEARDLLGVSHNTFAKLVRQGTLAGERNPLDTREKLFKRTDVEALARKAGRELEAQ